MLGALYAVTEGQPSGIESTGLPSPSMHLGETILGRRKGAEKQRNSWPRAWSPRSGMCCAAVAFPAAETDMFSSPVSRSTAYSSTSPYCSRLGEGTERAYLNVRAVNIRSYVRYEFVSLVTPSRRYPCLRPGACGLKLRLRCDTLSPHHNA